MMCEAITDRSRAVLLCPASVSPVTFLNVVFFRPQACAWRFIISTKVSTVPPTPSASATEASLPGVDDHAAHQVADLRGAARFDEHQRAAALALGPGAQRDGQRLLDAELLVAQRTEHEIGRHQLGQRGRVGRRVGIAFGKHLAAAHVEQQVALRRDLGRLWGLGGSDTGNSQGDEECKESVHGLGLKARSTMFLSRPSWPWKKCPPPGMTTTGSDWGRAQASVAESGTTSSSSP